MTITATGIDTVIRQLTEYKNKLESKRHSLLEKLAQIGIDVADVRFKTAQYDGVNDVTVGQTPEWINDNTLVISASGTTVTFIEFGTGVVYAEEHPRAAELGFLRGGYGQGKGSQRAWGYYGEPGTNGKFVRESPKGTVILTRGNPPARAMYEATKEMRAQIQEVAKEVFKND